MSAGTSVIVVGTSLGGLHALEAVLTRLPASFDLPIAVVQHRGRGLDDALAGLIARTCALPVCEPEDKQPLDPGRVYIAPGDYHLLVERGSLALSTDPPVNHARPAIDALFDSAAEAYGPGVVAVVLTGASRDGAAGAARVRAKGGRLIVQDPQTAECPIMPAAAIQAAQANAVLDLAAIAAHLASLTRIGRESHG